MRFGIPDSDSDDDRAVDIDDLYLSGDESDHVPDLTRPARSKLGSAIRELLMSSDSEAEPDSEDEVGGMLGEYTVITNKTSWREPSKSGKGKERAIPPAPRARRRAPSSTAKAGPSWRRWEPSLRELTREQPSEFAALVKETEAAAWREGYRVAGERRARMRQVDRTARTDLLKAQQKQRDADAEVLRSMMERLAVQQKQEEEDTAKHFQERERRLWADIDAAIQEAERRYGEEQAARAAAERKRKEEEAARIAAEEKAALARKAEAERLAKEKAEAEAKDKAERERQEAEVRARDEAARKADEERKAAAEQSNRGASEWAKWVAVQKRMKTEVISQVKLDRNLRQSMRLITRGLGQVVNTKESILRVTNDLCKLFSDQLQRPPSPADPVVFGDDGQLVVPYFYLLSHTAKALIKQADSEVSANPDAAFPLARVILGIMLRGHAAFGTVLYARLVKKFPWVVPYWPMRAEGQPRDEYEKSTGRSSDESTADYIRRMTGIVRMYFAVLALPLGELVQTLPSASPPTPPQLAALIGEPWRLPAAWTWAACALRAPLPRFPPTAYLLVAHIDTLGHALLKLYGPKQIGKLLAAIRHGAETEVIKGDNAASRATILLRIDDWDKSRNIPPPKGIRWS